VVDDSDNSDFCGSGYVWTVFINSNPGDAESLVAIDESGSDHPSLDCCITPCLNNILFVSGEYGRFFCGGNWKIDFFDWVHIFERCDDELCRTIPRSTMGTDSENDGSCVTGPRYESTVPQRCHNYNIHTK
jgi:hypothetical protein